MGSKALITGGAGFIGSHLLDRLSELGWEVTVLDNLSSGSLANISQPIKNRNVQFIEGDCTDPSDIRKALQGVDTVFHLAANPEVRLILNDSATCFRQNVYATHLLLEEIQQSKAQTIAFASTSTVYGDARTIPTPETHPIQPISLYGASKLASEALISAYAHTYDKRAIMLRLANIVGPRSAHGVIHDFLTKLRRDPTQLEILGDGSQTKSYLYIDDLIDAIQATLKNTGEKVRTFNVGSEDQINVKDIAKTVVEELGLGSVDFRFTSGVDGGRGWKGDVKTMQLDISKLKATGWKPKYSSSDAVRKTVKSLISQH